MLVKSEYSTILPVDGAPEPDADVVSLWGLPPQAAIRTAITINKLKSLNEIFIGYSFGYKFS
jgi:hypothetical protein